jgi:putative restriction endonuclease
MARLFGEIEGYTEGSVFDSREALSKAGVHRPTMAGISGTAEEGADHLSARGWLIACPLESGAVKA